jgi:hypothetical protein
MVVIAKTVYKQINPRYAYKPKKGCPWMTRIVHYKVRNGLFSPCILTVVGPKLSVIVVLAIHKDDIM